jgi:hypothetical protein
MTFGCQTYETGLFRTQLEEGIMGLSNQAETIPHLLFSQKKTTSKMFALCYRNGGGILTLGGVDRRIHHNIDHIHFAKYKSSGSWYGVVVKKVQFESREGGKAGKLIDIGTSWSAMQTSKGSIVDSGTTDTYLPRSMATAFNLEFKKLTGLIYSNKEQVLSDAVKAKLPNIIFSLQSFDGKEADIPITMAWSEYTENLKNNRSAFRVYLNEGAGAVLGANFMSG